MTIYILINMIYDITFYISVKDTHIPGQSFIFDPQNAPLSDTIQSICLMSFFLFEHFRTPMKIIALSENQSL